MNTSRREVIGMDGAVEALGLFALAILLACLSVKAASTAAKAVGLPPTLASGAASLAAHALV
jgi:hypothetical protein